VLFNSLSFLIFLPVVYVLYWFVCRKTLRSQNLLMLAASYFFYGWWSWKFLALLALSTLLDYVYGFSVASSNRRKAKIFLWLSVANNLGILGVFKYYNFFATQLDSGLQHLGLHVNLTLLNVALPIGISFYTFHGMSYVFDIFRGKQKPVSNFVDYAVFVSFFPLLVAGPIERANHLLPQVQRRRLFSNSQAVEGCRLIVWGMIKKVVIADSLAGMVNHAFNNYEHMTGVSLILSAIAFSFQIYGDFSGYSDIAIGTAKLFGFELLSNFKFPYFSRDIAEFWRRWHISLSSWFRDYLYIPLGGSKEGKSKAVRNTFIIFVVSGFWHGASWNFIIWGGIHACLFLPLLLSNRNRKHAGSVVAEDRLLPNFKEVRQMLMTFTFVTIAWVFFRAHGLEQAVGYLKQIVVSFRHPGQILFIPDELSAFIYIIPMLILDWGFRRDERKLHLGISLAIARPVRLALYNFLVLLIAYYIIKSSSQQFIYFQF
jgi:D-alanyl-lipoteichoic acid acyltransferase DltB (MBOAT superfamily)